MHILLPANFRQHEIGAEAYWLPLPAPKTCTDPQLTSVQASNLTHHRTTTPTSAKLHGIVSKYTPNYSTQPHQTKRALAWSSLHLKTGAEPIVSPYDNASWHAMPQQHERMKLRFLANRRRQRLHRRAAPTSVFVDGTVRPGPFRDRPR
jgi:hypothetical protein